MPSFTRAELCQGELILEVVAFGEECPCFETTQFPHCLRAEALGLRAGSGSLQPLVGVSLSISLRNILG